MPWRSTWCGKTDDGPYDRDGGSSCTGPSRPRHAPAPDHELERSEDVRAVQAALATLADRDREALLLKAEGFNYDEIAETLGLAKGAVGTTLSRARRRLVEAHRAQGGRHVAS